VFIASLPQILKTVWNFHIRKGKILYITVYVSPFFFLPVGYGRILITGRRYHEVYQTSSIDPLTSCAILLTKSWLELALVKYGGRNVSWCEVMENDHEWQLTGCLSQWPCHLRHRPWSLRLWVWIPLKVWMFVLIFSSSFTCHPTINAT
jgi:hypothetical protein